MEIPILGIAATKNRFLEGKKRWKNDSWEKQVFNSEKERRSEKKKRSYNQEELKAEKCSPQSCSKQNIELVPEDDGYHSKEKKRDRTWSKAISWQFKQEFDSYVWV